MSLESDIYAISLQRIWLFALILVPFGAYAYRSKANSRCGRVLRVSLWSANSFIMPENNDVMF